MKNEKMIIKFNFEVNSLYDLSYLTLDIYQLIVFSKLLEEQRMHDLNSMFFNPQGYAMNRYNRVLSDYAKEIKIDHVKNGSIEIIIAGVGLAASIIVPIVISRVQEKLKREGEKVIFEIRAEDNDLNKKITEFDKGYYGKSDADYEWLLNRLSRDGYSIEVISRDIYRISKVLEKYEKRMIRTIRKHD